MKISRGRYFTINSYGGVRLMDFCYDPIPEFCQILIPNPRILKEVTETIQRQRDKGSRAGNDNFCHWNIGTKF